MPDDSYVLTYFEYLGRFLSVGAPFYIVLNNTDRGYDFSDLDLQNRICGSAGCDDDSLNAQILLWSLQSDLTYVAAPSQSWIDEYFGWSTGMY